MGQNYFNTLPLRVQLEELAKCRFMDAGEFENGCDYIKGKKIVIVGCGAQGLNQGLNMRDSGCDIAYALRGAAIEEKRQSWKNASENGFTVGTYEELIPSADIVMNLTPDKQVDLHDPTCERGGGCNDRKAFKLGCHFWTSEPQREPRACRSPPHQRQQRHAGEACAHRQGREAH